MRRTSSRRPPETTGIVTNQAPAAEAPPTAPTREEPVADTLKGIGWGWRLALFLWAASFVFLFLYEILNSLLVGRK